MSQELVLNIKYSSYHLLTILKCRYVTLDSLLVEDNDYFVSVKHFYYSTCFIFFFLFSHSLVTLTSST